MARLVVLGLLKKKPMSGYEIQQVLQKSQTDKWAGILPGSIYHALKKMDKEGLVKIEAVEQTGNRSKAIYKITEEGEVEFQRLLKAAFKEKSVILPTSIYSAISFIDELPNEDILEALAEQKQQIEKELHEMEAGEQQKAMVLDLDFFTKLSFQNIYDQYKLQLKFINEMMEHLSSNDKKIT
ncbi:PadR family transcriptional regulator [Bacillus sp. 7586-K]|uniref:DNA-binding PadR family transcriptional regulator n=1 Tax=Metabacillus niabensis TaxID=324854 RepID=A0ABT9Z0I6_9BACI|nr:PadR family transcriptional regulator [Metabacillus niabensis]MDQ0225540.1 DNA-binding PadR family transcriptional regulator [Metabacillus niabensis]PAD67114.1 PadR family transcriptional regulator [Bacillus sp. 7586-K]